MRPALWMVALGLGGCPATYRPPRPVAAVTAPAPPRLVAASLRVLSPDGTARYTLADRAVRDAQGPAGTVKVNRVRDAAGRDLVRLDGPRWIVEDLGALVEGPDGTLSDPRGWSVRLGSDGTVTVRSPSGRDALAPVRVEGLRDGERNTAMALVLCALRADRIAVSAPP